MQTYKVIDNFQANNMRVLALDRALEIGKIGDVAYIDGVEYTYMLNSVKNWIVLPDVQNNFDGKTVMFQ